MEMLFNGDCLKWLSALPDGCADLVLTDPPYGINFQSRHAKGRFDKIAGDDKPHLEFIPMLRRLLKPDGSVLVFTRWDVIAQFADALKESNLKVKSVVCWDKMAHGMGDLKRSFAPRYELILFAPEKEFKFVGKRPIDVIPIKKIAPQKLVHPNEKPVELMKHLIRACCPVGGTVIDPFMGAGSVGVAAIETGRTFFGAEIDEKYFNIAAQRISNTKEKIGENEK